MTGELLALGASHKTASLELREKLALPDGRASRVLAELVDHEAVHEAVAISTCNRTELYLMTADPVEAENVALGTLSRQAGLRLTELLGAIYSLRGDDAVEHLFSVTAGLDSMIVGEAEVQGQVKRAYELALVEGATGPVTPSTSALSYERLTCPCTSASPTIIESSPPVTANRCSTAALPRSE